MLLLSLFTRMSLRGREAEAASVAWQAEAICEAHHGDCFAALQAARNDMGRAATQM